MSRKCDLLCVKPQVGNKVSHSNRKTKTRFLPNLKHLNFQSEILGCNLSFRVAISTLRTINKYGSIDNFLINFRYAKLSTLGKRYRVQLKRKSAKMSNANTELAAQRG